MSHLQNINTLKPSGDIEYFFDDIAGVKWKQFMESIASFGVLTPLIVTPDGKKILSGRQRYRACLELGIKKVPVEYADIGDCDRDGERAIIIESNIRQRGIIDSPSIKLGRIVKECEHLAGAEDRAAGGAAKAGATTRKDIRKQLGVSEKVANCAKALATMPMELQQLVVDGVIKPRVAYDCLNNKTPEEQIAAAQEIRRLSGGRRVTLKQVKSIVNKEQRTEKKGELPNMQTDSIYSINRDIWGQSVTISLTDEEAGQIALRWLDRKLNPVQESEPARQGEWKPVRAYTTGVLAQHRDEAIRMYEQGVSCNGIAEHFGVSQTTASRFLRNNGVQMRTPQTANRLRWANGGAA